MMYYVEGLVILIGLSAMPVAMIPIAQILFHVILLHSGRFPLKLVEPLGPLRAIFQVVRPARVLATIHHGRLRQSHVGRGSGPALIGGDR
jgi:hypothetical protein